MSSTNRTILIVLPLLALVAAFWLLVLGPKREEATELENKAAGLSLQVEQQELAARAAEAARQDFPRAYRRLVVLGKATPSDDDTASLLVQFDEIAADSGVKFLSLDSNGDAGGAPPPPAPADPQTPADAAESSEQQVANAESAAPPAAPAAATEESAAGLPIGASIGPAGLPV